MTTEHEASRTLVKSPPELWAECSDAGSLARHLGEFGEIQITRLEPESTVAWEGENASGTVRIEASGWGTRVTLTAQTKTEDPSAPLQAAGEAREGESPVAVESLTAEDESPAEETSPTPREGNHAAMEETLEEPDPGPVGDTGRARARWRRLTARMRGVFGSGAPDEAAVDSAEPAPAPEAEDEPAPEQSPEAVSSSASAPDTEPPQPDSELDAGAILASALDSLGQAHHRPFSRA
jgi:hypothetical protein